MDKVSAEKEENKPEDKQGRQTKEEYLLLLATFRRLMNSWEDSAASWQVMEELISLRTASLFSRVLEGLHLDFDRAVVLLRNHNDFTTLHDREERDILVAAIDNLVEFAAAEEFAMLNDIREKTAEEGFDDYESVCENYNLNYAETENSTVLYAASMAGWWMNQSTDTLITYMTQGDERVRDTHQALEGITYPKHAYPSELIPPIEWGCRCYLLSDSNEVSVSASLKSEYSKEVNPVFAESLAKKGRIFSPVHPYFTPDFLGNTRLRRIIRTLKDKLLCRK